MKKSEVLYQKDKTRLMTRLITYACILCICFLSVGYSAFSNTLKIENIMATVRPAASARITDVTVSSSTSGGFSGSEDFTKEQVLGTINLPNDSSTVTYRIDVTVFLSSEMKLTSITGLDPSLEYTMTGYNMGDILCDGGNHCNLGATDDIYITIGYKDGVNTTGTTEHPFTLNFNFEVVDIVAKIGDTRYQYLQDAIDDVPANNTQVTIDLLKDTSEALTVTTGQNITFNMHGNTISNKGTTNVIVNTGTITMTNGTITSKASQGAINNNAGGVFIMTGGTISATGTRQAIYNDGGSLTISGSAVLRNTSSERAPVQNLNNGTLLITGGTIESTRFSGVANTANLTIGVKDGDPANVPVITGKTYGISSTTNFNYYDGIIKGGTNAFNDETLIHDTETTLMMLRKTENIGGVNYEVVQLGIPITITFNANGGSVSPASVVINKGGPVGTLPVPTKTNAVFDGWFTSASGGTEVHDDTTFNADTEIFAHWSSTTVAKIGTDEYATLEAAISAAPANTPTTITIVKNIVLNASVELPGSKRLTIDLNNHTISNSGDNMNLFENKGTSTIMNGTLTTNSAQGAVNNRVSGGNLTLSNLTITATGTRQAVYNERGTITITGNCHLSNTSSERAAVQNKVSGTINIISATIVSTNFSAVVADAGTINIGTKDGSISTSSPSITGSNYGVDVSSTLHFYDGVIKGKTDAIHGTVSDSDGTIITGTDGDYKTAHLE